ncbi:MAG: toll/interleukin-1 receptor domain-containing protein [Saprospiraceae bacterium]|nr:toll/interleukin-1 receptor domain-containing protein [Saprospiraceae bacterium]
MRYKPKCFLSYAHVDREFVRNEIVPILIEFGLDVWINEDRIEIGSSIFDSVIKGINEADLIVAIFNRKSTWLNFEIGAAIGQNKPTIGIIKDDFQIPSDLRHINFLVYSENEKQQFSKKLRRGIEIVTETVIDKSIFELNKGKKIIGIRVGFDKVDFESELRFTADFVSLIKKLSNSEEVELLETSKGSFKSFFSLDLKAWAELLEKVIFFIPEWKKKKAENMKIIAEVKHIEAETNKVNSDIFISEQKLKMEQAETMADLLLKYKELGVKFQIDDDLLLTLNPDGQLLIKEPQNVEKNTTDNNT